MVVERLMMTRSNPIRFKGSKGVSTKNLVEEFFCQHGCVLIFNHLL